MRIVFVDTYPTRRGAQVFVSELTDFLTHQGYLTKKIYLYRSNESHSSVDLHHQDIVLNFRAKHILEKIPTIQPSLLFALIKEIKTFDPDVVLLNGSRTLKYGALAKQFLNPKTKWISRIIDNTEFWNSGKFTHWYYKKLVIPQLDGTIGVSHASLNSMIRHYNFKNPSTVIHRVFDPIKFKNAPTKEEARRKLGLDITDEVLLFLGNLTQQKRPDRFLEIVQKLNARHPNLKALIVGDGDLRLLVESEISNLKSQIFMFGYQKDVSPFLAAADLLVLTSDTEGLPGVVLEAAHFGIPTVGSDVGGMKECLKDGETGYVIEDRSVHMFCTKISHLLANPSLRIAFGENARKFVEKNFQMEKAAKQYLDFFEELKLSTQNKD